MISFVVPAHNEEALLPQTLQAIKKSAQATGQPFEMIVVNDASTDRTAQIAEAHGARVVHVKHRQIAATRNSGARAALGERIFFVDADTIINAGAVAECLRAMDKGAVGGGGLVEVDGKTPLWVTVIMWALFLPAKFGGFCGGAFMFCTREAFHATDGFSEKVFWGEEGFFGFALKRYGRFVVIWRRVLTSGRRFRALPGKAAIKFFGRGILHPIRVFTDRSFVKEVWYDSNRQNDNRMPNTFGFHFTNFVALLVTISLLTGPLLQFVPWSLTPLSTTVGKIRYVDTVFLVHVAMLLWPVTAFLCVVLMRTKFSIEWLRTATILALCWWQTLQSSIGLFVIWSRFFSWAAA